MFALLVLWFLQRGAALPNTTVAGVDVSGASPATVRAAVEPIAARREQDPVTLLFEGDRHELLPADVGYRVDVDATVEAVLGRGRSGLPGDIVERLRSLRATRDIPVVEVTDVDAIAGWVDELSDQLDRPEREASVSIDPTDASVEVVRPQGEVVVRRAETGELVLGALRTDGPEDLELPADTTEQSIADEDVDQVVAQVERALEEPLVVRSDDASLTLEPTDLAALMSVREAAGGRTGTTLELVVTAQLVEERLGEVARGRFERDPVSASYTASRTPPSRFDAQGSSTYRPVAAEVGIEPGRDGARFEADLAAVQLTELVRAGSREAELRLATEEPRLGNERAEELRPTHAIGTFTTYYQAGQVRNANIQRLADVIDGALVLPGEQFSINEISGNRSCDKGYHPAGTIVRGELVDTCGGGVSQFGTTTFNAAFFSGVQLDQWRAHSWYISRYPMGREATLSYPELDVRFTNTSDHAILVKTGHTATSITVTLYGRPIADAVRAEHGSPTNHRTFSTEYRNTNDLRQGQERVEQAGTGGFTVDVRRIVELAGGGTDTQTIRTVYVPQTRIIERGTAPAPPPPPPPEADDDPPSAAEEGD